MIAIAGIRSRQREMWMNYIDSKSSGWFLILHSAGIRTPNDSISRRFSQPWHFIPWLGRGLHLNRRRSGLLRRSATLETYFRHNRRPALAGSLSGCRCRVDAAAWHDEETDVAQAIGPTDVHVVNHHGSREEENPFWLATLRSRGRATISAGTGGIPRPRDRHQPGSSFNARLPFK
jgi:hypothetical protein